MSLRLERLADFFRLPALYSALRLSPECRASGSALAWDLLCLFFDYRTFPDNYGPCRLWEVDRSEWSYYYGSNYQACQRAALTRHVQPAHYAILLQDKTVCERLCRDERIRMPRTLGTVKPLGPYRKQLLSWLDESATGGLIVKPLAGAAGQGIVALRRQDGLVVVTAGSEDVPLSGYELREEAIVQERVQQDPRMGAFSADSLNTIRVVTMMTPATQVLVLAASMRCGVGRSCVDNWSAGGVAVGVDVDAGVLQEWAYDRHGGRYATHPTTNARFAGFSVPGWPDVLELARVTQSLFPWYRLLGVDIGIASDGTPVLIEVNNNTDLMFQEQTSGPLLRREQVLCAFGQEALLINRHQRALYAELIRSR